MCAVPAISLALYNAQQTLETHFERSDSMRGIHFAVNAAALLFGGIVTRVDASSTRGVVCRGSSCACVSQLCAAVLSPLPIKPWEEFQASVR